MKIIGLTGGIASGKSTVTSLLRQHNLPVLDADAIAWELAQPDRPLWQAYVNRYGEKVLLPNRQLNRQAVADIVFRQPEEKKWMDSMAHPIIKAEIQSCQFCAIRVLRQQCWMCPCFTRLAGIVW